MAIDRSTDYATENVASDIHVDLTRAYVPPGTPRGEFLVFDPDRAAALTAWVSVLIPGSGAEDPAGDRQRWPSAADVGAVEYIDRTLALAPRLRPMVLGLIGQAESIALAEHGQGFGSLLSADQYAIMTTCEKAEAAAFGLVKELTYEAYYRDPAVLRVVERRTGFRPRLAVDGFAVARCDDEVMMLLAEVAERPGLVREVDTR
jgi:hypothetical protein